MRWNSRAHGLAGGASVASMTSARPNSEISSSMSVTFRTGLQVAPRTTLPNRARPEPAPRALGSSGCSDRLSSERAGILLEDRPRLVAELAFPFGVEAAALERVTERLLVRLVERHAGARHGIDQLLVEAQHVLALFHGGVVERLRDGGADVLGHRRPLLAV